MIITNANMLKVDPSRTGLIRSRFCNDLARRFRTLRSKVYLLVVTDNSFGLPKTTTNEVWQGLPSDEQLARFKAWIGTQIQTDMLPTDAGNAWWNAYIKMAYRQGVERSWNDTRKMDPKKKPQDFYTEGRNSFLVGVLGRPPNIDRVKALAARAYSDMEGITDAMSQQMSRVLVNGLITGTNPRDLAKELNAKVDGIGLNRALTLARTEIVAAHAEGQLDGFETLGLDKIGVAVEWDTAGDGKVCPACQEIQGVVLSIKEARGMIPRHAGCRCAFVPANVGEDDDNQIDTKNGILSAIKKSLEVGDTNWQGSDVKISSRRPESLTP